VIQQKPRGLADVVLSAESFIKRDPFLFYLGDNVIVGGVKRFVDAFRKSRVNCQVVLAKVKDPERFGVPEIRNGRIVGIEEKPKNPKSEFAVTGIYIYDATIFEAVHKIRPSARGELEISDAHQYLIDKKKKIGYSEISGWWKDTGKPEDLLEANRLVLDKIIEDGNPRIDGKVDERSDIAGKVVIGSGTRIVNSHIRGPAIIGEKAVIENSYIGPFTSIHDRCELRNSEVEYSIVLQGCRIIDADIRIERSLLGKEVEIVKCTSKPKTQKFIVGDQSVIELT
jgi:glucose-1-phosphate thymidylyltransferase